MKTPADFPRLSLGFLPTPIEPLKRLSADLGIDLALKRDDFTGFGGGSFGTSSLTSVGGGGGSLPIRFASRNVAHQSAVERL